MGQDIKYVNDPLDERYFIEPTDETINHAVMIGPPEEKEVHDILSELLGAQEKLSILDTIISQLFGPTSRYKTYLDAWNKMRAIIKKSPEHRAACSRIANNSNLQMKFGKICEMPSFIIHVDKLTPITI